MRSFFVLLCIFFSSVKLYAQQQISSLPIPFNQYMRTYAMINPASNGSYAKTEVSVGNQRHGANWSNINTFYFNGCIRLSKDRKTAVKANVPNFEEDTLSEYEEEEDTVMQYSDLSNNYHVAGINLTGDKEGTFLNRTGVYAIYAWHTHLSERLMLSAGTSLGVKNYSVGDNYINGGGSAFAPDGSIGLWLYNADFHFGASANQLFNGKLKPIGETTVLTRQYNITAGKLIPLNHFLSIKPSFLVSVAKQNPVSANITIGSLWQDVFSATINYKFKNGLTYLIGLEKVRIGDSYVKMMFSYYVPVGQFHQLNINTYEITLNYFFKQNSREHVIFQ